MPYFTDAEQRQIIRDTYGNVVARGTQVADFIYTPQELAGLPRHAVELALGVGHPVRWAAVQPGETVLDVGCGAGIDSLLAARQVGPAGRVIALDMTPQMLERARRSAAEAGAGNIEVLEGLLEEIPLPEGSMDVVISNGVLNLSVRKGRALAEMYRVLKPGGRLSLADLALNDTLPEEVLKSPAAVAG